MMTSRFTWKMITKRRKIRVSPQKKAFLAANDGDLAIKILHLEEKHGRSFEMCKS